MFQSVLERVNQIRRIQTSKKQTNYTRKIGFLDKYMTNQSDNYDSDNDSKKMITRALKKLVSIMLVTMNVH